MGKRKGGFAERNEDQFGGFGGQDRDNQHQFSQKSRGGGGTGGSQTRHKGGDLNFQRHVPKFLQQYSHLLGGKRGGGNADGADEDAPVTVGQGGGSAFPGYDDSDDDKQDKDRDEDVEADALRRAMEDNPELAKEFEDKLNQRLNQAKATEEKERGNKLFAAKKYKEAIECFTQCIELDPQCEVYWSNRSAAHAALEDWEAAAVDARQAVKLKANWVKGYSRLAVAYFGLKLYSDSVETYKKALELEPDDRTLQQGLQKAELQERLQVSSKKHVFFNKKTKLGGDPPLVRKDKDASHSTGAAGGSGTQQDRGGTGDVKPSSTAAGKGSGQGGGSGQQRKTGALSFADEEEEA